MGMYVCAGYELNGKIDCVECVIGKYSNLSSNNKCIKYSDGQKPNTNKDSYEICGNGEYSNTLAGNVCYSF
jgi:hypothetical protein